MPFTANGAKVKGLEFTEPFSHPNNTDSLYPHVGVAADAIGIFREQLAVHGLRGKSEHAATQPHHSV